MSNSKSKSEQDMGVRMQNKHRMVDTGVRSQEFEVRSKESGEGWRKVGLKGFTLIEMLVVIAVFSVLAILATQSLFLTLRSSARSESVRKARENLDYAVSSMERNVRNASALDVAAGCTSGDRVDFTDVWGYSASYYCKDVDGDSLDDTIASFSAFTSQEVYLTNDTDLNIESCSITCTDPGSGAPVSVNVNITATAGVAGSIEGASVNIQDKIFLRTY